MYNSAVFSSVSTHPYTTAVVSHDFLSGSPFSEAADSRYYNGDGDGRVQSFDRTVQVDVQRLIEQRDSQSTLQNLSSDACLIAYRNELLLDRRDVLAVSSVTNTASSLLSYGPDDVLSSSNSLQYHSPLRDFVGKWSS